MRKMRTLGTKYRLTREYAVLWESTKYRTKSFMRALVPGMTGTQEDVLQALRLKRTSYPRGAGWTIPEIRDLFLLDPFSGPLSVKKIADALKRLRRKGLVERVPQLNRP